MFTGHNYKLAEELLEAIWFFNNKGWTPATSTNYSVRSEIKNEFIISRSGTDKSKFSMNDFLVINEEGKILPPFDKSDMRPSAETEIHSAVYKQFPEVNCVLHTHSVLGTVLSQSMKQEQQIVFEGFEILKGLEGNITHEMSTVLPIVPNSQVISEITKNLGAHYSKNIHGFLIAGHGLYAWGRDIAAAKRHIETFEFLFECHHAMRRF